MERNSKEKYVQIDQETSTNKIFAMLDKIDSDNESDINKLLEESDTEYVAEEPVPKTKEDSHNILIPELSHQRRNWNKSWFFETQTHCETHHAKQMWFES